MVIEESIEIRAVIEKVWKTFTDLTCWADWNTVLQDVIPESELIQEGEKFICSLRPLAFPIYLNPEIQEVIPHKRVVWTGSKYGIFSRHEFLFETSTRGTLVTSREKFSGLPLSVVGKLFPKWRVRELTVKLLADLKETVESEETTPDGRTYKDRH